jgi:hypothetical protein
MVYFGAAFLGALLVPEALHPRAADGSRGARVAGLALAALLGALLAAPSLVPAAAHLGLSPRGLGVDEEFAGSVAWSGLRLLPSLFVPNLLGQQVRGDYVGGGTQWEVAGYYAGMLSFALAMYALVGGPRERRSERLTLGALLAVAVALAPGRASPLHALAVRVLPGYGAMRCPPRALYVFALAVPLLAADGLDLALERARRLAPPLGALVRAAAPLVVALDLLWFQRAENPTVTLAEARARAVPAAAAWLADRRGDRFVNDVHLDHALHNAGLLWNLDGASGYSSLPLWRYVHLLWIANHGAPYPHPRLRHDLSAQGIWRWGSPIVDALNIRWVIAPRRPDAPGFVERRPPDERGFGVYENLEALPRGWVVHRARVVGGEEAAARAVAEAAFDPRHEAVLERAPAVAPAMAAAEGGGRDPDDGFDIPTAFERLGPDDASFTVRLRSPGLLVVSLPAHPGWRAMLDGAPVEWLVADYALIAVAVPAGEHRVQLALASRPVDLGLALGGVGAVLLAALAFAGRRRSG